MSEPAVPQGSGGQTKQESTCEGPVGDLLLRWEELHAQGVTLSPEELCRDCPEHVETLRRQIAQLAPLPLPTPSVPMLPVVPGYEVVEEIGRGGMGVVYRARHLALKRPVALKMLLAGPLATGSEKARFRKEAEAVARLQHPHIVQVFEVGECLAGVFFSMEYLESGNLANRLLHTPLPVREAACLLEMLSRGVQHAHERGILHRDLKPANILLQKRSITEPTEHTEKKANQREVARSLVPQERAEPSTLSPSSLLSVSSTGPVVDLFPKITDFGLAKKLDEVGYTQTGDLLGTPSYMAPEQAEGRNSDVGPASDVWALGAILYECLVGRPPFKGSSNRETLLQVIAEEPVTPARLRRGLPPDLETICLKCLEREPARRYSSATELADDLGRFLRDEPIRARPLGSRERLLRWARRNPVVAGLVGCVSLLLVVLVVGATAAVVRIDAERRAALESRDRATEARTEAVGATGLAERRLGEALRSQAEARRWGGRIGQRVEGLRALAEAARLLPGLDLDEKERRAETLALRNQVIACLGLPDLQLDRRWLGYSLKSNEGEITFDPTLTHFAREEDDGSLAVHRLDDGQRVQRLEIPGRSATRPELVTCFSPDGRLLAAAFPFWGLQAVQVWEIASGKRLWQNGAGRTSVPGPIDFSSDGSRLAYTWANGRISIVDALTGKERRRLPVGEVPSALAFHPRKNQLAVVRRDKIDVIDLDSLETIRSFHIGLRFERVCWSPDGSLLGATTRFEPHLGFLFDVNAGQILSVLRGHQRAVRSLAFHPSGNVVATSGWDGSTRLWSPWTGRQLLSCEGAATLFSRDGNWLGWGRDGRIVGRWRVFLPREFQSLPGNGDQFGACFSADGRTLATAGRRGVGLWDLADGQESSFLPVREIYDVQFLPSGAGLLAGGGGYVLRWPVTREGTRQTALPRVLLTRDDHRIGSFATDAACRTLAVVLARGNEDGAVGLLSLSDPTPKLDVRHPHLNLVTVALSPDGRWLAAAGHNGLHVRVWEMGSHRKVAEWKTFVGRLAFDPDSRHLLVSANGEHRLFRTGSWKQVAAWPCGEGVVSGPAAFSPDGRVLALATDFHAIGLHDAKTGQELATLQAQHPGVVERLVFDHAGEQLVALSGSRVIHLWDLRRIRERLRELGLDWEMPAFAPRSDARPGPLARAHLPTGEVRRFEGPLEDIRVAVFVPDGKRIVTCGTSTVRSWDLNTGKLLHVLRGHTDWVRGLAALPDGRRAVSCSADRTLRTWDLDTGKQLHKGDASENLISLSVSSDGKRILTGGWEGGLAIWESTSREKPLLSWKGHAESVQGVALSADGTLALSGCSDGTLKLWDTVTGKERVSLRPHTQAVVAVAVDSAARYAYSGGGDHWDGGRWVIRGDYVLRQWDVATGREVASFRGHAAQVQALAVSPDGRRLLSGDAHGMIHLWEVGTGRLTRLLAGHGAAVRSLAFSSDGRRALSSSADGSVRYWDVGE